MALNDYIGVYKDNPTINLTNGTRVSEGEGAGASAPISITLNATNDEVSAPIKLALRCLPGYQTATGEDTVLSLVGTSSAKWKLILKNSDTAPTVGEQDAVAWGTGITIPTQILNSGNYIFWAMAKAESATDLNPVNDESVDIQVVAVIEAV